MRIEPLGLVLFALIAASGCGKKVPIIRLHDTEGRKLLAKCDDEQGCRFKQKEGAEWPGRPELVLHTTGMLRTLCNVEEGAKTADDARYCRALECTDDRECPPEGGAKAGHCINGLCVDPIGDLTPDDAIVLCLAGKGLGADTPAQIEAHSMGLNCGTPCQVPRSCRQP